MAGPAPIDLCVSGHRPPSRTTYRTAPALLCGLLVLACLSCTADRAAAQDFVQSHAQYHGYVGPHPNLFHNYYVGPAANAGGMAAQLYLCPRPAPAYVGHTAITYEPFYPHEYLYRHARVYKRYHFNGSTTKVKVAWW